MSNVKMVEFNNNKYIIVDKIVKAQQIYCLLAPIIDDVDVSNEFEIYIYNEREDSYIEIEDEETFYMIKDAFEKKLKGE